MNRLSACRQLLSSLLIAGLCLVGSTPGIAQQPSSRTDYLGDPLPAGAILRLGTTRLRHPGSIDFLQFTGDGKLLIAVGYRTSTTIWDVETGKRINTDAAEFELLDKSTGKRTLARINPALRTCAAFGREGNTLLAVDYDDNVTAWDLESGKETQQEQRGLIEELLTDRKSPPKPVTFQYADPLTGREMETPVRVVSPWKGWSLAEDGKHLSLPYWSANVQRVSEAPAEWAQASGGVYDLHASLQIPGKQLAVKLSWDYVSLQNLADNEFIWTKEVTPPYAGGPALKTCRVNCLTLSPDGKIVAAATDNGHINLLDVATGERVASSRSHPGFFSGPVQFVPGGKLVIVAIGKEATLWNLSERRKVRGFGADTGQDDRFLSLDGESVLVGDYAGEGTRVRLEETVSGKILWTLDERFEGFPDVQFSGDGQTIALDGWKKAGVIFVSAKTGERVRTFEPPERTTPKSGKQLTAIRGSSLKGTISPDGRLIAYMAYTPTEDGKREYHHEVRDLHTGEVILKLENCARGGFSADSKIFASAVGLVPGGNTPSSIEFYDLETKQRLGPPRPHQAPIRSMTFAPSGNTLAVHYNDSTVIFWDARAGAK